MQLPPLNRFAASVQILLLLVASANCSWFRVKQTRQVPPSERALPAKTASKAELIDRLNSVAKSTQTLNLRAYLELTGGSANTPEVEKYRESEGYILVKKPSLIRIIVLAFKVTVFDMVSNDRETSIYVPPKNKFYHFINNQKIENLKIPVGNMRPYHIFQAVAIEPIGPESERDQIILEEDQEGRKSYYILNILKKSAEGFERKIWFDRFDLNLVRQKIFNDNGQVGSDISYSDFKVFNGIPYPTEINFRRPQEEYSLRIQVKNLKMNEVLKNDQFVLEKPAGAELVELAEKTKTPKGRPVELTH
jgi:outer membrane lipoprotein-sorting protein